MTGVRPVHVGLGAASAATSAELWRSLLRPGDGVLVLGDATGERAIAAARGGAGVVPVIAACESPEHVAAVTRAVGAAAVAAVVSAIVVPVGDVARLRRVAAALAARVCRILVDGVTERRIEEALGALRDLAVPVERHLPAPAAADAGADAGGEGRAGHVPRFGATFLGTRPSESPRVAVITPYFKEPRPWLERCLASVRGQDHPVTHFVVADGHPQAWLDDAGVRHLRLDRSHADFGNTPRSMAAQLAVSEGFDAICFLDADNWYEPDHVSGCLAAVAVAPHPVDYVVARRRFVRDDGRPLPRAFDEDATPQRAGHVDTNCYFLLRGAFHALGRWILVPKPIGLLGDRVFRMALERDGRQRAFASRVTVNYLCTFPDPYLALGEEPPLFAYSHVDPDAARRWWHGLPAGERAFVEGLVGMPIAL